jgi:hypothetical protein
MYYAYLLVSMALPALMWMLPSFMHTLMLVYSGVFLVLAHVYLLREGLSEVHDKVQSLRTQQYRIESKLEEMHSAMDRLKND